MSSASHEGSTSSRAVLERALRPLRIVLAGVALGLTLMGGGGGLLPLAADVTAVLGVVAGLNLMWNIVGFRCLPGLSQRHGIDIAQVGADVILALGTIVALDSQSTPLAWILLFVPVLDAGIRYGLRGAVGVWFGISLVYMSLFVSLASEPAGGNASSLRTGIQHVLALLVVAVPTIVFTDRLRGDLDATGDARALADEHVHRMRAVSAVAQKLSSAADPGQVLALAAYAVRQFGFERADISTRIGDQPWELHHGSGRSSCFDAATDPLLQKAFEVSTTASIGIGETTVDDEQRLHDAGYAAVLAVVVKASDDHWIGIRGYSARKINSLDTIWESLETLGSLIAAAWTNRTDHLDLTRRARQMQHDATHDALTGLPNRILLLGELERAIENKQDGLALLFLDLNGFKSINDTHGHDAGDQTLIITGRRIASALGGQGTVARLGGDEFVVMVDKSAADELEALSLSIIDAADAPIELDGATVSVGTSIGIASWQAGERGSDLMRRADAAMYEAKQAGRTVGASTFHFARRAIPEVAST